MQALLEDNGGAGFMHDVADAEAWDPAAEVPVAADPNPEPDEPQEAVLEPVQEAGPAELPGSSADQPLTGGPLPDPLMEGAQPAGMSAAERRELLARAAEARRTPTGWHQVRQQQLSAQVLFL